MTVSAIIQVNAQIAIPRREIRFSFVRSSGPGGQNVNKVASKAVLRWEVATSPSIPDYLRPRVISHLGRRINDRGELVLTSQRYRDQAKNIDDCLQKLCELVASAVKVRKRRKKTALPRSAREARLKQKRSTGAKKQRRQRPGMDD
jgi:ribosome-associated protein